MKELTIVYPKLIFKGGTSLSKCYDVIDRFSEDIDFAINFGEISSGKGIKKENGLLRNTIIEVGSRLDFILVNEGEQYSGSDLNQFLFKFDNVTSHIESIHTREHILVETMKVYKSFPFEEMKATNYITKFLELEEEIEIIKKYELQPFTVMTQSIERTFIDKIFAICDYYIENNSERHSRHVYDLHMIYQSGQIVEEDIQELFHVIAKVRRDSRRDSDDNPSAEIGFQLVVKLNEIISTGFYQDDYESNTKGFIAKSKEIPYVEIINSIKELIKDEWIPREILSSEIESTRELEEVK